MNTIQVILSSLLLLLAELAAIAFAVIFLLLQANLILLLVQRLTRSWRCRDRDGTPTGRSSPGRSYIASVPDKEGG